MSVDCGTRWGNGPATRGAAHCHPADTNVPEIGDELAAGRAMHDLAHQLLNAAGHDIQGMGAAPASTRQPTGWPM
ncbi:MULTISPECIES: dsRBD fold-containing protein [unclassified Streptomyces]|uniref:dsRBD fold-containing protein n=1 Tax=unclassified Streptomyces TaxID=2593676 RepID=UPI00386BFDBD